MREHPGALAHHIIGVVIAAGILSGCVSQVTHERTLATLEGERASHQEARRQLATVRAELVASQAQVEAAERATAAQAAAVDALSASLSDAELSADVAATQRAEQLRLVNQLRGELGRAGDHLRVFARERSELMSSLAGAEERLGRLDSAAAVAERSALLMRDLALAIHEPLDAGKVELAVVDGEPTLRVPAESILDEFEERLRSEGSSILAAVTRVARAHGVRVVAITEEHTPRERTEAMAARRLEQVVRALVEQGIAAEHVVATVPMVAAERELAQLLGEPPGENALLVTLRL
ncbi:MAG: hypothetical protein JW751_21790 [Polyangiaceae bacterium]|nr:hypothetical protein [Polyangiaceae bacterium]